MALPGLPTSQTVGTQVAGGVRNNYLANDGMFATGFNVPEVSMKLSYLYPRFYITSLLDRMNGRSVGIPSQQHIWGEKDRTRPKVTIASLLTAVGSATINVTVSAASLPAMVVGRRLIGSSNVDGNTSAQRLYLPVDVTAVSGTTITLAKADGTNWAASEIATTGYQSTFGLAGVYVGEGSSSQPGFWTPPTARDNYLSTIRSRRDFTGDILTQKSYLGDDRSDVSTFLFEFLQEFQVDREIRAKFGTKQLTGSTLYNEGLFDSVFLRGSNQNYGGPLTEAALQQMMVPLKKVVSQAEWLGICGTDYSVGFHNANKEYALSAEEVWSSGFAGHYGPAAMDVLAGYEVYGYKLQYGKVFIIVDPMLDDPNILTMTGSTSMGSYRNFSGACCWINLGFGMGDNVPLIRLMHKENNGLSRKFVYNEIKGITGTPVGGAAALTAEDINFMNQGAQIATDTDGVQCHLLSEEGMEARNAHWHGWHFKTA